MIRYLLSIVLTSQSLEPTPVPVWQVLGVYHSVLCGQLIEEAKDGIRHTGVVAGCIHDLRWAGDRKTRI